MIGHAKIANHFYISIRARLLTSFVIEDEK